MSLELPPIVYVMGPSGAGKDSLLQYARAAIGPGERIAFAHRYITRPAQDGGENHVALSMLEFETRRDAGLFAFHWRAHDTSYGIGVEVETWRRAGFVVVVNGSRQNFAELDAGRRGIVPLVVTAAPGIRAERLARRGREDAVRIRERLAREPELPPAVAAATVDNSGTLEDAGCRFTAILRVFARGNAVA